MDKNCGGPSGGIYTDTWIPACAGMTRGVSYVEAEVDYVAVTNYVFLAFEAELARGLDGFFIA